MVAGVAVGKRVKALAAKAKSEGWSKHKWPGTWATEYLVGTVLAKVGRKWRVEWDACFDAGNSVMGARNLVA